MARLQAATQDKRWWTQQLALWAVLALTLGLLGVTLLPASATLPGGTTFDAGDGNESDDGTDETDWASPAPNLKTVVETASGAADSSMNTDEDDVAPLITAGNVQGNKADLLGIKVAHEQVSGLVVKDYLYLAWNRPADPSGNVDFDFELNKLAQPAFPAAGQTWNLNRSAGDILLTFELLQGGTAPKISMRRWVTTGGNSLCESNPRTPCWGPKVELTPTTSPAAEGSVLRLANGDISFGEMAVDLGLSGIFTPGSCTSFASVYAKSRSAGSGFNSQISDVVPPVGTTVTNCGSITVAKDVTGPVVDGDQTEFGFTVACPATVDLDPTRTGIQNTKTLVLTDGASATVNDIPIGSDCTVTETAPTPASAWSVSHDGTATTSSNVAAVNDVPLAGTTVTFTNARTTGGLTISKTSTGGTGTFLFTVDCDGTAYDRTATGDKVSITTTTAGTAVTSSAITGIPTGTDCTVAEDANSLYSTTRTPADGEVTIGATTQNVSFTNTRKTATLTVDKLTTGGTGTFRFEVECDGSAHDRKGTDKLSISGTGTATVNGIPTGTSCTVTEDVHPDFTSSLRAPSSSNTVTIADAGSTVHFQNVRKTGTLTVTKTTTGGTGTFTFEVECDGTAFDRKGNDKLSITGSGQATVTGIPTGTECTVTETTDDRFTSTRTPADGTVTMDEDGETVSFSNVRNTGTLTVSKTTSGGTGTFRFEVDCSDDTFDRTGTARLTVVDTGSATITGIPTGVTCTVTETADPLFTSTRTPANGTVTLDSDGEQVSFTNVRRTGSLTVTKATTGGNGSFSFAVDCSVDTFDRAAVVVTTTGGAGSSTPIAGIPTGTTCQVTETVPVGWAAVGGATRDVTIDEDGETAAFANRKLTSGIAITKQASAPTVHRGDTVTYTYVVTNAGETALTGVGVVDDKCSTVTGPTGDAGADGVLGLTETWTFTCSQALTATTLNTAVATGTDPLGVKVTDEADATVTVINSVIAIDKTPSATSVAPGTTVVYTYTVTNLGDVPLTAIAVADDKCSPVTLASGDANGDAVLQLTETWVFRCSQVQTGALDTLTNVGTASGTDPLGRVVKATDTVTVSVVAPLVITQPTAQAVVVPAPEPAPAAAPIATAPLTLPRTGIDVNGWIQLGASLILLGVSLLLTSRQRRRTA